MNKSRLISELLVKLADAYGAEGRPGGDAAAAALLAASRRDGLCDPTDSAPSALLKRAAEQPGALPISATIGDCCQYFHWTHWAEGTLDDRVSSKLFTTELVGPDGLFHDSSVRVGLLISASDTDYPVSSHSGEETYLVISGVAQWTLDGSPYRPISPGALVHHPSWMPHGRRTLDEVFLGAWRWSGDLDLDSFRVDTE